MASFTSVLRPELKKAIWSNPWFWVAQSIGCGLALFAACHDKVIFDNTLAYAVEHWNEVDSLYSAASCFAFWMPLRSSELAPGVFLMIWPLLTAIPYAWSWCSERQSGMLAQLFLRAPRQCCVGAKAVACMASGALSVALPFMVNLAVCACFAPASPVWVSDILYIGVSEDAPLSSLFYTLPFVFCIAWTCVASVIAGLWGATVLAVSALLDNYVQSVFASYLVLHIAAYVGGQAGWLLVESFPFLSDVSALLSANLFEVVSVNSAPGAVWELLAFSVVLAALSVMLLGLRMGRDVL